MCFWFLKKQKVNLLRGGGEEGAVTRAISRDGDSRDGLRVCHMRTNPVRASHHAMPPHVLQRLPVGESARAGRSTKFAGCVMAAAALAPRQGASDSVTV